MVERIDFGKVKVRIHNEALILLLNTKSKWLASRAAGDCQREKGTHRTFCCVMIQERSQHGLLVEALVIERLKQPSELT
jgi:hypothetical protein